MISIYPKQRKKLTVEFIIHFSIYISNCIFGFRLELLKKFGFEPKSWLIVACEFFLLLVLWKSSNTLQTHCTTSLSVSFIDASRATSLLEVVILTEPISTAGCPEACCMNWSLEISFMHKPRSNGDQINA